MTEDDTLAAWDAVYDALARLPGWEASPPSWHPEERLWNATAFYVGHVHIGARRPVVSVRGMTQAEALHELAAALADPRLTSR